MSDNTADLKRKRTDVEKHTPQSDEMQTSRLIVKNLPFQCNKNELKSLLDKIVNTKQIRIPKKKDNTSRGFGYIDLETVEDANKLKQTNGLHF